MRELSTKQRLTSYMEDSLADANHLVWLEGRKDRKMTGISGQNLKDSSEILDLISSLVRTYLESSSPPLTRYVKTWSVKDTPSGYSILKLRLSERGTEETESSLSPIETTSHLWRTPDAHCDRGPSSEERLRMKVEKGMPISLNDQVKHEQYLFPTPTAFDATCGDLKGKEYTGKNRHAMKLIQAVQSPTEDLGGGLNPAWVSWLMGLPANWTELED